MLTTPSFRAQTNDHHIWDEVVNANCYRLPDDLAGQTIVDIGCHIGSFALACLVRDARMICAFEPEPENYRLAYGFLAPYANRCALWNAAVVRSDIVVTQQYIQPYPLMPWCGLLNTGGQGTLEATGVRVRAMSIDALIDLVGTEIDLMKVDCQGSEWPILLTATRLVRVRRLVGEFQEYGGAGQVPMPAAGQVAPHTIYTAALLADTLKRQGFTTEIVMSPHDPSHTIGLFFAERL